MRSFGALEARNRFRQLIDIVEHGEEVIITRRSKKVARVVPSRHQFHRHQARAAVQRRFGPFDWSEWKAYRDDGRL
jgi:prevent-host-death family protein